MQRYKGRMQITVRAARLLRGAAQGVLRRVGPVLHRGLARRQGAALPRRVRTSRRWSSPSVREHSLQWIWHESPAFQAFRGDGWMKEPCRSCPRKAVDFGGCRCQAFALTGDAANTDPVCTLSPAPPSDRRGAARARRRRRVRLPRFRRRAAARVSATAPAIVDRRARARLRRRPGPRRAGRSTCPPARWSACWAPTARARPRRCCCWPRCSLPRGAAPACSATTSSASARAVRRRLGLVFQETSVDGLLTVEENLRFAARLAGLGGGRARGGRGGGDRARRARPPGRPARAAALGRLAAAASTSPGRRCTGPTC